MAWKLQIPASLALLLSTLGRMAGPASQPTGAVPGRPGGMCYHLVQERMPYGRAWVACGRWGRRLARVHQVATREALRTQLGGAESWWVATEDSPGTGIRSWPKESHHPRCLSACAFVSRHGLLQRAVGAVCLERHPFICEFGPGQGAECPLRRARSPTVRAGQTLKTQLEPPSRGSLEAGRRAQRLRRHLGQEEPYPEMTAIWEALQSVHPRNWQQELVHRLSLPVQEDDGFGSASKMDAEMRLFQAVSEHLLQRDTRASPHWPLLSILALHGCSRLLQASLGRCSPGSARNIQQQEEEAAALARSMMQTLHLLEKAMWQDKEGILESALISISAHRFISSDLGNATLSFPGNPKAARVILPGQSALDAFLPPSVLIRVQLASFLGSPFFPSGSAQRKVTGAVAELDLLAGETEILVSNLSSPVQVFLPQTAPAQFAPPLHVSPGEALLLSVNVTWTEGSVVLHAQPEPQELWGLFLLGQHRLEAVEPSMVEDQGGRTWLVGPASLPVREGASRFLLVPLNLSVRRARLALRLRAYGIRCVSWHPGSGQWSEEGCAVGPLSSLAEGHCLCSHLSFYGTSFWVLPVQVDIVRTAEYFAGLSQNPIMLILLGVLYALYLGTVAWARWMDGRTLPQIRPALLDDDPCAQYGYLLRISLPGPPDHDSDSCRVCIWLHGSSGTSKPRYLPPGATIFLLCEPCPLGELQSIWLWQESPVPPRYVTEVTVKDLQQRECFHFPCHAWLTRGEDGPCAPQRFLAAPQDPTFWTIFWQRVLCGFRDEHTVLVVLRPPPHTAFTRVQRISCFWCLLLCSSLISLMFWETADESPQLLSVGSSFSLSWKDVVVSVESALIAFPINFLIVFLFQNTKPRRSEGALRIVARPNAPADPRSLDAAVLENLHSAVETLSRARRLSGSFGLQYSLRPSLDLEGLLHLLARMILPGPKGEANSTGAEPSPDPSHESYCKRYVLRKLQHVAGLLEEQDAGLSSAKHAQALQQVRELARVLDTHLPAVPQAQKKQKRSLPWWSVFVGWALLASLSAVSTFFVLLYGFHYGKESVERWLVSTAISLCQNLFVLQPLKVVSCAVFFALALKKPEEEEDDEMSLEMQVEGPGSLQ